MSLLASTPLYNPANASFFQRNLHVPTTPFLNLPDFDNEPTCIACPAINDEYFDNLDWVAVPARQPTYAMKTATFDSDSFQIGIDSLATACMSHELSGFIPSTV